METILAAFVTGLTAGGLSCLAVQGGLLASSVANQVENNLAAPDGKGRPRLALPILLFLLSKLAAYTLLGFLLGLVGSAVQLSATGRAILLLAVGVFMVGSALRLFNVHPFFRIFAFEPPRTLTRYIRRKAKNNVSLATPLFLGALTVFIPCGVAQTMIALALGTGDPLAGAAILSAFTLGTSPVFFLVSYFITQLGARLEKHFMRFVAVIVLVLGLVTIESGLNLIGAPFSVTNLTRSLGGQPALSTSALDAEGNAVVTINVINEGYTPTLQRARAGVPVKMRLVTENTFSCARDFVIPSLDINELLPKTGVVEIPLPAQAAGSELFYTCSMGMYTGKIVFEP